MCGISGLWFQEAIKEEILLRYGVLMSNAQFKRGPDSDGVWADISSGIVLSHRRLSIRDLSKRNQPMRSHDNNLVIVFNGEIYNFEELKYELKNYKWQGTSDTEILLAAIQTWGLEVALRKCYGMFAFALWNIKKNINYCKRSFWRKAIILGKD